MTGALLPDGVESGGCVPRTSLAAGLGIANRDASGFSRDHGPPLLDMADFFAGSTGAPYPRAGEHGHGEGDNTGAPFGGLGGTYSRAGGVVPARDHGAPLMDKDLAGVVLAREHGVPFEKAQGVAAAGLPPTSPDAGQVNHLKYSCKLMVDKLMVDRLRSM